MSKNKTFGYIIKFLQICLISLIGVTGILFTHLCLKSFDFGLENIYISLIKIVSFCLIFISTILALIFMEKSQSFIYKLSIFIIVFFCLVSIFLYYLKTSGILDKINSIEDFRNYISSTGNYSVIFFIVLQFLQVVILPIPSFITVGAGVVLFGPLNASIYSYAGIVAGSILAYYIGKILGYNTIKWLIGEKSLNKVINLIKGKDKVILTLMFLFPFFPDDLLCFVAGVLAVDQKFFIIMIILVRLVTIFVSSYSLNNSLIPFNTWWGILCWIILFILVLIITALIYKKTNSKEK